MVVRRREACMIVLLFVECVGWILGILRGVGGTRWRFGGLMDFETGIEFGRKPAYARDLRCGNERLLGI